MGFKMRTLRLPKARTKEDLLVINGSPLKRFSWRELKSATDNFSKKNMVGRGGFGSVYRGRLEDDSLVAIKRCHKKRDQRQDIQFQTELEIGGCQVSDHPNVLRLRGYCMTGQERILVYPFLVNGSVASRLWDRRPSEPPLDWAARKRIALGAAKGLAHVHGGSSFTVIHRDMKAGNILLDAEFNACLGDFGLAKFVGREGDEPNLGWQIEEEDEDEEDSSSDDDKNSFTTSCWNFTRTLMARSEDQTRWSSGVFSRNCEGSGRRPNVTPGNGDGTEPKPTVKVSGTLGYLAPEYYATDANTSSLKTDVYGYGVVLLELISGRRAYDPSRRKNNEDVMLQHWAKRLVRQKKSHLVVDPDLRGGQGFVKEEMEQLLQLALLCTIRAPSNRPIMSKVIKTIEDIGNNQLQRGRPVRKFLLLQLEMATNNFSSKNLISRTGSTYMYRGRLGNSNFIIKRLLNGSKRCRRQFRGELKLGVMAAVSHPNLLQLHGYCIYEKQRFLVYPFMDNRSLKWRLRPERTHPLDWTQRKKIALGVAKGIAYLHYHPDSNTITDIHRHVKPSNVLLDHDFYPFLSNMRLRFSNSTHVHSAIEDSSPDRADNDDDEDDDKVNSAFSSVHNDVYEFGMTLFVIICGHEVNDLLAWAASNHDNRNAELGLHDCLNILGCHGKHLSVDPRLIAGDNNYDSLMDIKDEVEQLMQVALLCTQPFALDRPEMSEVIKMLQGISQGGLNVCSAFDRANLFSWYDSTPTEPPEPELPRKFELEDVHSPALDTNGCVSAECDEENHQIIPESVPQIDASGLEAAHSTLLLNIPKQEGIFIWDDVEEPAMQDRWKIFLYEVVSDALSTKSKLCRSGMRLDPLCPLCNEFEEDNLHLFFNCDFSNRVWQSVVGLRMDMLGFGSVKEAVDAILRPKAAKINIPWDGEASQFSHEAVAVMYSIWTHRNEVCFDKVSPDVMEVVSLYLKHCPENLV